MTRRILLPAALALALAGPAGAQPGDAPPSTPTDLVANAYSGTAGGIRWARSSDDRGAVSGYEITRDGTVLDVRDALSYVDRALAPATTYLYGVTAIDNAGQRSGTATIRLRTGGGAAAEELSAPTGLRASVYSATAAEIFWTRPPTFGLRYELFRDGEPLAITDGTSYFDDTLAADRRYAYDVVAIDRQGRRSASSRVELRTLGGVLSPGPAAPTGLRASVYSATAAEIFWTRPPTFGLRYEVRRDGARLATSDGTSYFDDTLSGGTAYTYEVIAIDRQGRRSASSAVTLTTLGSAAAGGGEPFAEPDPDGSSTIARLGYPAALALGDELVSAAYLALYYEVDRSLSALLQGDSPDAADVTVDCPGGGSASGSTSRFAFDVVFDRCTVDGVTLSGGLERDADFTVFGLGSHQTVELVFDALRIEADEAGTLELTGESRRFERSIANIECGGAPTLRRETDNRIEAARIETGEGVTTVSGARWAQSTEQGVEQTGDDPRAPCTALETLRFDGAATVESTRPGPRRATLSKRGDIVRDARGEEASSASARLEGNFGDGSTLVVTLSSDADGEAQVDILADGVMVSFTAAYRFEAREDIPTILGD